MKAFRGQQGQFQLVGVITQNLLHHFKAIHLNSAAKVYRKKEELREGFVHQ